MDAIDDALNALMERLSKRRSIHHVSMAVVSGDESLQWFGATGDAGYDRPMTVDTPYFLASIDKLWVATVALQLVEHGDLDLDRAMVELLDPSLVKGLHRLDDIDRTKKITVRHLLGHTSGLPDWLEDRPKNQKSFVESLLVKDRGWTLDEAIEWARDRLTPRFAPQDLRRSRVRIRYSDTNYVLLMRILETVVGLPINEILTERIVVPLGLTQTWVAGSPAPAGSEEPARVWGGGLPLDVPLAMASFPAIYSTSREQIRVMRAVIDGTLLDDAARASMQQRWIRFALPHDPVAARAPSWPIEYGLGTMRYQPPRFLPPFRSAPMVVGHTGSTGSWVFHCPELDLYLSGTVDQVTAGAIPFRFLPRILTAASRFVAAT